MTPGALLELAEAAIDRFKRGEAFGSEPFLYLVVPRATCPTGKTIRLFGRSGPSGRICTVKEADPGFEVVAVFPARPIVAALASVRDMQASAG